MEHWGDPWADIADDQKSPTKNEVTSPQPPTYSTAPTLLNGFLDDAGWGNDDNSFGEWSSSSGNDATIPAASETRLAVPSPLGKSGAVDDGPHWDAGRPEDSVSDGGDAWARQEESVPTVDKVPSEMSDASTTIQRDEDPEPNAIASPTRLQPDDDSSARPSISPSETSRNEAPVESPRTSFEEEGPGKHATEDPRLGQGGNAAQIAEDEDAGVDPAASDNESVGDESGTFAEDTQWTETSPDGEHAAQNAVGDVEKAPEEPTTAPNALPADSPTPATAGLVTFTPEPSLLDELFPSQRDTKTPEEAPDDPIYSTSGRKAWYRLTRKQTMRESNSGNAGDNYIRVTWAHSQVRTEVNKIVGRWAREDRLSGTGPGAGASFYWDTPAPADTKVPRGHLRTKTAIPTQRAAAAPVRQSLPPVSTDMPAAFNWSSPTATVDPWKQDSTGRLSSPIAPKHPTVDTVQTQELRAVSMDLTRDVEETPRQTLAETPAVAQGIVTPPISTSSDPWGDFSALDTNPPTQQQYATAPPDDDDDWGEMISSPTVSTPISAFPNSTIAPLDSSISTLASTPTTPPSQEQPTEKMQIARLRGTISPTSALFGAKSFVPLNAELGPIGPGLLRPAKRPVAPIPAKRSVTTTPEKDWSEHLSVLAPVVIEVHEEASNVGVTDPVSSPKAIDVEPVISNSGDDEFSVFTSSTLPSEPARPSTPPPAPVVPVEPAVDAWADADFSFFESTVPAVAPTPTPAPTPPRPNPDPSDPFSVFSTPPPRSVSVASSAKTSTRSPPRDLTPPPVQPLSGATNSAQRRKNEEEQVIRDILVGLPDLSYMLH
jgi:hypothetical protein